MAKAKKRDEYFAGEWAEACPKCGRKEFLVPSAYKRIIPLTYYPHWKWDGPMRFRCHPNVRNWRAPRQKGCGYEGPNYEFQKKKAR